MANLDDVKKIQLFEGLSDEEYQKLLPLFSYKDFLDKDLLIKSDDNTEEIFFVLKGRVQIELVTSAVDEKSREIGTLGIGESIGELILIKDMVRTANARSKGAVQVLMVEKEKLLDFFDCNPKFGLICFKNISVCLVNRLQKSNSLILNLIR